MIIYNNIIYTFLSANSHFGLTEVIKCMFDNQGRIKRTDGEGYKFIDEWL